LFPLLTRKKEIAKMSQTYAELSPELQALFTQVQEAFANIGNNHLDVALQMATEIAQIFSTFNSGGTFSANGETATVYDVTHRIWQD
jgi:hypothetical protein